MTLATQKEDPAAEYARRQERVWMYHPDIPHTEAEPVERSREQYDVVHADQGWRLLDTKDVPAAALAAAATPDEPVPVTEQTTTTRKGK